MPINRYQCRHCGCMTQALSPDGAATNLDRFRPCTSPTRRHACKRYIQTQPVTIPLTPNPTPPRP